MGLFGADGRCRGNDGAFALALCHLVTISLDDGIMTNTIALWLIILIVALLGFDYFQYDAANTVFLLRRSLALIEWVAFWR
jgi:hypothetical protein